MASSGKATPIINLTGTLLLDGSQGPLDPPFTTSLTAENPPSGLNAASFSGTLTLQQTAPSILFHLGGSLSCPLSVTAAVCDRYNLSFGAIFSSDTDFYANNVGFSFDAIIRSTYLSPNDEFSAAVVYSHLILSTLPQFFSGTPVDISSGVGFSGGNLTEGDLSPTIQELNPSITSSFPFGGSTQLGGPAINSTEMIFLLVISGLRPGEVLEFPNSFTFSILPTAADIPEPATLGLAATAGLLFWAMRRRRS